MIDANEVGLYSLLFLALYTFMAKRLNFAILIPLFSGVFLSVSKIIYAGFILIGLPQIFEKRKWLFIFMIPMGVMLFMMFYSLYINDLSSEKAEFQNVEKNIQYKMLSRRIAANMWKDHFLLGAGPGIFDKIVAQSRQASLKKEYDLPVAEKQYLRLIESLDKFWLRVLAELGIVGGMGFAFLAVLLFIVLIVLKLWATSDEVGGLFIGLALFTIVIMFCSVGSGLKYVPSLFTYAAFVGMGIGSESPYDR